MIMSLLKKTINSIGSVVTGSRKYGIPRDDSDIDLVVHLTEEDLQRLASQAESVSLANVNSGYNGASLRFGNLNLIAVTEKRTFDAWKNGTQFLSAIKPVTKEIACLWFDTMFKIQK